MTIHITPIFSEDELNEFRKLLHKNKAKFLEKIDQESRPDLTKRQSVSISKAEDANGNIYENIEFVIDTRYVLNGDTFFANNHFLFNYTHMFFNAIKTVEQVLEENPKKLTDNEETPEGKEN